MQASESFYNSTAIELLKSKLSKNLICHELAVIDERGYSFLHWAVYFDDIEFAKAIVENSPDLLKLRTKKQYTCLHIAANQKSMRCLSYIIHDSNFDNLDAVNCWGETALHVAAALGDADIIIALLSAGSNATIPDKWGRNPYQVKMFF